MMTTLPKLIEIIQPYDGRDKSTLMQFGRVLREAGYIPKGKTGKGAPNMCLEHGANLLLGTYGAASPKDGPKAVFNLRSLETYRFEGDFHEKCEVFPDIMEKATFGEAIEELILGVPEIATSIVRIMDPDCALSEEDEAEWRCRVYRGMGPAVVNVKMHAVGAEITVDQCGRILWRASYCINDDLIDHYVAALNADRKPITQFSMHALAAYLMALLEGTVISPEDMEGPK